MKLTTCMDTYGYMYVCFGDVYGYICKCMFVLGTASKCVFFFFVFFLLLLLFVFVLLLLWCNLLIYPVIITV